ncbi:MAG TPA: hypothetical protein VGC79_27235, partial [Polyangiaceae bacterium]
TIDQKSYCAVWTARQRECEILGPGRTGCVDYHDAAEPCETECIANASCAQIVDSRCSVTQDGALRICWAKCVGLQPFTCKDGRVLAGAVRCNGQNDCTNSTDTDDTDEAGCTDTGYKCRSVNQFVPYEKLCDQHADCLDGTDEHPGCETALTCSVNGTMTKIPAEAICSGVAQCDDGSDQPDGCAKPLGCAAN